MEITPELERWAEENKSSLDPAIVIHEIAAHFDVTADEVRDDYSLYQERVLGRLTEKRQDGQLHDAGVPWELFGQRLDWIEVPTAM